MRSISMKEFMKSGLACGVVILLAAGAALAQNSDPRRGRVTANPTVRSHTFEQEVALGRQAAAEIERKLTLVPADHPASQFINDLGQKLARAAPGYRFPYTFRIVREGSVNAFALPGGPIYLHTGLIEFANEAELAGVLGHEIAHVVMRHSVRQASRQMRTQIPLAILGGVVGSAIGGWGGGLAQMGISFGAGTVLMKHSRARRRKRSGHGRSADNVRCRVRSAIHGELIPQTRTIDAKGRTGISEFASKSREPGTER